MKIFITDLSKIRNTDTFFEQKAGDLTPVDAVRFAGIHHTGRKLQFLVGRLMIYRFFGKDFTLDHNGKPVSEQGYFSLSHSGDLVALAVSDSPVGIDAENIMPKRDYHKLGRFLNLGPCRNNREFYRLFTQYEADFKLGNVPKKQHIFWLWKKYLICVARTKSGRRPPVYEYFPALK